MSRRKQLVMILVITVIITSGASHFVAWYFRIITHAGEKKHFGVPGAPEAFAAGSSLVFNGINWHTVSESMRYDVVGYVLPAASVSELEIVARHQPSRSTFIGISAFDVNEYHLCNYRAQFVPFREEVRNLYTARSPWVSVKKILSQYPFEWIRLVFPTVGQDRGILAAFRDKLRGLIGKTASPEPRQDGPMIDQKGNQNFTSIEAWTPAHAQRALAELQGHEGLVFDFQGTKRASLLRLIAISMNRGPTTLLVVPESPRYRRHFLTPVYREKFEDFILSMQRETPGTRWIRFDHMREFESDTNFWDLLHMNGYAQKRATQILLQKLAEVDGTP